jgi:hypothetical protein
MSAEPASSWKQRGSSEARFRLARKPKLRMRMKQSGSRWSRKRRRNSSTGRVSSRCLLACAEWVATAHPLGKHVPQTADKPKETELKTMFNKVILIGRLGQNAEAKTAQNNKEYVTLNIATQESWKNDKGEYETRTEWHLRNQAQPMRGAAAERSEGWTERAVF